MFDIFSFYLTKLYVIKSFALVQYSEIRQNFSNSVAHQTAVETVQILVPSIFQIDSWDLLGQRVIMEN